MKDITRHNITEYFSDLYAIKHDPHQTEAIRNSAQAKLYILSIVAEMMAGEVNVEVATNYEEIEERGAIQVDGTWFCADQFGSLFAMDDLDCLWYEIDVVDDDPDVTLYYMDIRDQCLGNLVV